MILQFAIFAIFVTLLSNMGNDFRSSLNSLLLKVLSCETSICILETVS